MIKLEVNVLCKESGIAAIFAQGRYSTLLYISDGSAVWPTKSCPAKDRMPLCQRSPQQCPQSSTPKNRPKNYSSKYHLPEEDSLLFSGKSEPAYILQSQSTGWAHRVLGWKLTPKPPPWSQFPLSEFPELRGPNDLHRAQGLPCGKTLTVILL